MKCVSFLMVLGLSLLVSSADVPQSHVDLRKEEENVWTAEWFGVEGRTYFVQYSENLLDWHYFQVINQGNNAMMEFVFESDAPKLFVRLVYIDDPTDDPEGADFDNDGLTNGEEVFLYGTDPFNSDTSGDGMPDGWKVSNGLDPNDDGSINHHNGPDGDPDGDGRTNFQEFQDGTNPIVADEPGNPAPMPDPTYPYLEPEEPSEIFESAYVVLTGDLAEDVIKESNMTLTIPAGRSAILIVAVFSEEFPFYTGHESEFNDILTWDIDIIGQNGIIGSIDVNSRHDQWQEAEDEQRPGVMGFDPIHIEVARALSAPDDDDLEINIDLTATNIGDDSLPSTVIVGLLPVEPVELHPRLPNGRGQAIEGSEFPRLGHGRTNGMVKVEPMQHRIAHREVRMRITDGEIFAGRRITWSMEPLFVAPEGETPEFRGDWALSQVPAYRNRFSPSVNYGENGFELLNQEEAVSVIDDNGESAIRINIPPVAFNSGRIFLNVEAVEGDGVRLLDMEVPAVIVIDPGHGGTDAGAVAEGVREKDLTRDYSLELRQLLYNRLRERQPFHRVIMTRATDRNLPLEDRPPYATNNGAEIFLSVHFNSGRNTSARGVETFIERRAENASPGNPGANVNFEADWELAQALNTAIHTAISAIANNCENCNNCQNCEECADCENSETCEDCVTVPNRGVKEAGFRVTRDRYFRNDEEYAPIRICLVEIEFISNAEARELLTGEHADLVRIGVADALANEIMANLETYDPE